MATGELPRAPIWDDVRTLLGVFSKPVDIIYGGFPCQDISQAGARGGLDGKRSRLFFEVPRLVSQLRPSFVFLENVPAITLGGLDRVCLEFTSLGYDCRWTIVSAGEVGACHLRERWWLCAHTVREGLQKPRGEPNAKGLHQRSARSTAEPMVQADLRNQPLSWIRRMDDGLPLKNTPH
jgi:DNA (cytosine-5)-methyltransferase 1